MISNHPITKGDQTVPEKQANSSFARDLGGRLSAANAEHANKPVDTGNRRLPANIKGGVAKLSTMYTKQQEEDGGKTPKGKHFFRASAIVITPKEHNGQKVEGLVTSVIVPLCDIPAKGERKGKTFSENWYEFQNYFKLLGIAPCPETPQTDPTGQRTEAYFMAAMKTLTDPKRPPVYIEFSTRGWTPPANANNPHPEEMVFEEWHGLAQAPSNGQGNPAAKVQDSGTPPMPAPEPFNEFAPPPQAQVPTAPPPQQAPPQDNGDVVAALVETAMNDPEGATPEGADASGQLEEMAWALGWSKADTKSAADWAAVGEMALNPPSKAPPTNTATGAGAVPPTVGSKHKFCKRTKDGNKLKDNKGNEFPPQEVEVLTVDLAAKTCTVKNCKDGKTVVDIKSKEPIQVKFEWLE